MSARPNATPAPALTGAGRGGLLRAAAITIGAALVINLIILAIAKATVDVPDRFTPLQPGSVVFMTVLGIALATGVFAALRSRSADPVRTFRRLVPIALIVSLIPDVLIWAGDAYDGAARAQTVLPLMAMHGATAAVVAGLLPEHPRRTPDG